MDKVSTKLLGLNTFVIPYVKIFALINVHKNEIFRFIVSVREDEKTLNVTEWYCYWEQIPKGS